MKYITVPIFEAYGLGWRKQKLHGNGTPVFRSRPAPVMSRKDKSMAMQGFRRKK